MTSHTLILGDNKGVVSKAQKRFNKLVKQIENLKKKIELYKTCYQKGQELQASKLVPAREKYLDSYSDYLFQLDKGLEQYKLRKKVRESISAFICQEAFPLIQEGKEVLIPLYDKHSDDMDYATEKKGQKDLMNEMAKVLFEESGIEIDDEIDFSDEEQVMEFMAKKRAEILEEERENEYQKQAKKKKSAKQTKKEAEESNMKKSARAIYLDLVKAFHPDKEQDPEEKERKAEIMKRVTAAYEENNLLDLMKIQLEYEQISQEKLNTMAEEKLIYINKVLYQQVKDLKKESEPMRDTLEELMGYSYSTISEAVMEHYFDQAVKEVKTSIKQLEKMKTATKNKETFKLLADEIAESMEEEDFSDWFF